MTARRPPADFAAAEELLAKCARLERALAREQAARRAAEDIAENGLRALYLKQEQLNLLSRVATHANQCNDPEAALRFAVEEVRAASAWAVGHALITRGEGGRTRLEGTEIWSAEDPQLHFPFLEASRRLIAWPGPCAPGLLFAHHAPIWVEDVHAQCGFSRRAVARHCHLRSSITVPVLLGQELVAAMEFHMVAALPPDPGLMDVLMQIGLQIARVFNRKRHADALMRTATTDSLTGLPNRAAFEARSADLFSQCGADAPFGLAVLFMDLDGFKLVNDTLGHAAGDALLMAMAQRLRSVEDGFSARQGVADIMLARLAGDEFAVLIMARAVQDCAHTLAAAIHQCLLPAYRIESSDVQSKASIGIAYAGPDYHNVDELLRDADVAMYQAKSAGPGNTAAFSDDMRKRALRRLEMESDLRAAIAAGAFELHYQPIVAIADRQVLGLEALLRWRRPPDQLVMPDQFIGLAETTGLIIPIGTWVLREACRAVMRFRQQMGSASPVYVSVNVAAQQFQQPNFVQVVRDILLETGADPRLLYLELTETSAMANPERASVTVEALRAMGVRVSLDDFGTGYSSLAYLKAIPFHTIKVDGCFVRQHAETNPDWSIVTAVKSLADSMGLAMVVEGVEDEAQLSKLRQLGCTVGQGYLFNRPLAEADIARTLN